MSTQWESARVAINPSTGSGLSAPPGRGAVAGAPAPWRRLWRVVQRSSLRWVSPLVLLGVWFAASATGVLASKTLDSPQAILATAVDLTRSGELPDALWVSLERATLGLLLGTVVAVVLGVVAGTSRMGDALIDPPVQMVRTIPLFGLIPLFILWFGIGEQPKILLIALGVVIPLYLNLTAALRGIDYDLREVAHTLRLTRWERARHLIIPAVLPGTLVGFRQSLGIAWLTLIVAEQINADAGLGFMINNARDYLQTNVVVVGLLAYAVLGLITDLLVRILERRALRWRDEPVRG